MSWWFYPLYVLWILCFLLLYDQSIVHAVGLVMCPPVCVNWSFWCAGVIYKRNRPQKGHNQHPWYATTWAPFHKIVCHNFFVLMININQINCNSLWNRALTWPIHHQTITIITISSQLQQATVQNHRCIHHSHKITQPEHNRLDRTLHWKTFATKYMLHKRNIIYKLCHCLMKTISFTSRGNVSHFPLIPLMDESLNEIQTLKKMWYRNKF